MSVLTKNKVKTVEKVLDILPKRVSMEISGLCKSRLGGVTMLREIRLRAEGRASLKLGGVYYPLFSSVSFDEVEKTVMKICDGAVYASRDRICDGYLPLGGGVRVGIVGSARYEGGALVGVESISSLVFRIPFGECDTKEELLSAFSRASEGMLVYSPPGGGKTTALRALARLLGSGEHPKRVCIIDEREEFLTEDYTECEVDILKGYKRQKGLEIAVRTMSPEVLMIDEIGSEDARGIAEAARSGIPIIATAHAGSLSELFSKISLKPLFDIGAFDVFAGIFEENGRHILKVDTNG